MGLDIAKSGNNKVCVSVGDRVVINTLHDEQGRVGTVEMVASAQVLEWLGKRSCALKDGEVQVVVHIPNSRSGPGDYHCVLDIDVDVVDNEGL